MDDLIERQAAIDKLDPLFESLAIDKIKALPSAQPEIVRCKDCANASHDPLYDDLWCDGKQVDGEHYCSYAKRRTDEKTD